MLHYFPTPYPDELWYSVLCRYHVRSGNQNSATTFRSLFHNKDHGTFSTFLPDGTITEIAGQVPEGMLNVREIALNHTLFNYTFRFQTLEDKESLLKMALNGRINFPVKLPRPYKEKELKCCPLCMKEDLKQYGEAYWHTSHQIPYVSVCQKHKCRLNVLSGLKDYVLNGNLFLPDVGNAGEPNFHVEQTELEWTETLTKYLTLPLEYGPTDGYNNLYEGLLNAGYGSVRKDHYYSVDYERLGRDLCGYFGSELIETHFGTSHFRAAILGNIKRWLYKMPERYAVIAVFLKQGPESTFGPQIENRMTKTFLELSRSPVPMKKRYVAEQVGVKEDSLDILCHNLNIKPFWEQRPKTEDPKKYRSSLYFTKDEWEYIQGQVKSQGFQSVSSFMRYCLNEVREKERCMKSIIKNQKAV